MQRALFKKGFVRLSALQTTSFEEEDKKHNVKKQQFIS